MEARTLSPNGDMSDISSFIVNRITLPAAKRRMLLASGVLVYWSLRRGTGDTTHPIIRLMSSGSAKAPWTYLGWINFHFLSNVSPRSKKQSPYLIINLAILKIRLPQSCTWFQCSKAVFKVTKVVESFVESSLSVTSIIIGKSVFWSLPVISSAMVSRARAISMSKSIISYSMYLTIRVDEGLTMFFIHV